MQSKEREQLKEKGHQWKRKEEREDENTKN